MNTVKSVYYGWAAFIAAGGGAYYFAKQSINADRAAKAEADRQKRIRVWQLEQEHLNNPSASSETTSSNTTAPQSTQSRFGGFGGAGSGVGGGPGHAGGAEESGNPSVQASADPAPTRHEPVDEAGRAREKSKYEASDVYRSRKGDRFS